MSKKTPKNAKAKIKSEPSETSSEATLSPLKTGMIVLSAVLLLVFAFFVFRSQKDQLSETSSTTCLRLREECINLEVAGTDEERIRGLSERNSLPYDQGMLFSFDQAGERCFWMKDMRFNIDMVWTDPEKKIIRIKENVSPDSYPEYFCADNTKYVLEFNSGFAAKYGLKPGTALQF